MAVSLWFCVMVISPFLGCGPAPTATSARAYIRFGLAGAVSAQVLRDAMAAIAADLSRIDGRPAPDALVGMGGAITNITAVKHGLATYDPDVVQGAVLERSEIDRQIVRRRHRRSPRRRSKRSRRRRSRRRS